MVAKDDIDHDDGHVEDDIGHDDDNVEMMFTMMKMRMGRYPKEGSDTPRALEGQIFSTLFSIAA